MSAFFITGLPCSRTAWLANLFCHGNVFCFHDLLGSVRSMEELARVLGTTAPMTGDSDSGLLACYGKVHALFPEAPWLLVSRPFDDAWESLCRFVASGPWQESLACTFELQQELRQRWEVTRPVMIQNPRVMEVPFASLEDVDTLERIWKHLCPKQRWDRRRALQLQNLRVQPFQARAPMRPAFDIVRECKQLWPS